MIDATDLFMYAGAIIAGLAIPLIAVIRWRAALEAWRDQLEADRRWRELTDVVEYARWVLDGYPPPPRDPYAELNMALEAMGKAFADAIVQMGEAGRRMAAAIAGPSMLRRSVR